MSQERKEGPALEGQPLTEDDLMKALDKAKARISDLEGVVSARDNEISLLKQSTDSLEGKVRSLSSSLSEALSSYASLLIEANPDIPAEMLTGQTLEAVGESLRQAKTLVSKVRKKLETDLQASRVPAGAPERSIPEIDLSAREKIRQGLTK